MGLILTENDLRSHPPAPGARQYQVEEGTFVTESARSWLEKRDIQLVILPKGRMCGGMSRTPLPDRGSRTYLDAATGLPLGREKPEEMTHLRGNLLVKKSSPRIAFRGKLDSLQALVVLDQALIAGAGGSQQLLADLDDVLKALRNLMRCDVLDEELHSGTIIGLTHGELREHSHNPMKFYNIRQMILPSYTMGRDYALLNQLRAAIRETEVAAANAFYDGFRFSRSDIIEELNRLSSALHIMMCKYLAGDYKGAAK